MSSATPSDAASAAGLVAAPASTAAAASSSASASTPATKTVHPPTPPYTPLSIYSLIDAAPALPTHPVPHERPVKIDRAIWNSLGDYVASVEKRECRMLPPDQFVTIRLDIRGMSKLKKVLLRTGVIDLKWSPKIADMMTTVATTLAKEFAASYVYTQSDEITMIISPPSYMSPATATATAAPSSAASSEQAVASPIVIESKEDEEAKNDSADDKDEAEAIATSAASSSSVGPTKPGTYEHPFGGRRDKLVSLSASLASVTADRFLSTIAPATLDRSKIPILQFDARVGSWPTLEAAFQLILWRAFDCSVNGVSDAVYNEKKSLSGLNTKKKLDWLAESGLLPLPPHQAYGTLYAKRRVEKDAVDPRSGKEIKIMRSMLIECSKRNVVNMVKAKELDLSV